MAQDVLTQSTNTIERSTAAGGATAQLYWPGMHVGRAIPVYINIKWTFQTLVRSFHFLHWQAPAQHSTRNYYTFALGWT
jgi:hypothetical protein